MTVTANLHRPEKVQAKAQGNIGVLSFDCADGSYINVFLPYEQARAMADAFNAAKADQRAPIQPAPARFATSA